MGYTIERGGDREAINRIDAAQRHRAICGRADRSCYCLFVSTGVKGPPVPSLRPRTTAAPPMGRAVVVALRSARCCSGCTTASALHGSESACLGSSPQRPLLSGRPVPLGASSRDQPAPNRGLPGNHLSMYGKLQLLRPYGMRPIALYLPIPFYHLCTYASTDLLPDRLFHGIEHRFAYERSHPV